VLCSWARHFTLELTVSLSTQVYKWVKGKNYYQPIFGVGGHLGGGPHKRNFTMLYTLFQNGRHLSILLFTCKLAPFTSLLNSKFKRIFSLKRGNKGSFSSKQKNTKMAAILE